MNLRDELLRLYERDGRLDPHAVVDEATDETSPLHTYFTWDDTEAAAKWRVTQARQLIARCKITVSTTPDSSFRVRAFVHVPEDGETAASYVPTTSALTDDRQRDLVIAQAMRDIAALRRKYATLVDFDQVLRQVVQPAADEVAA